jgi:signal transduction histidine kinase
MLVIGLWVTRQIEDGVTRNTAAATALYIDSVIAPLLQNVTDLSPGARRALDETLSQGALGSRLVSFKIWLEGGLIAYSSEPSLIGKRFSPSRNLREAWSGHVSAEFNDLDKEESELERAKGVPLLEVYSPIREPWSGKVVAVIEFYEIAHDLEDTLQQVRLRSWFVVAAVTLCMIGLLCGIVFRGSRLIRDQRRALEERVADLSRLLGQNEDLRRRVQGASGRAAALNERYLKRVSADLHDGPAQLLALASLRLDSAPVASAGTAQTNELEAIRAFLDEAMREIRNICRGLTLPQLEVLKLPELLKSVVVAHEQRTGTNVALSVPHEAPPLTQSEKICIYRFVQEALANAFRHAGGVGQAVVADVANGLISLSVSDQGPGFDVGRGAGEGLGIAGLRERVESLGGEFAIESSPSGTRLTMRLKPASGVAT